MRKNLSAAVDIHNRTNRMSFKIEKRIGIKISTHTVANTGLVVTGDVNIEKGTHII